MSNYQNLVAELIGTLEDLREKKEELKCEIYEEEEERRRIEKELEILSERLDRVNETIMRTATEKRELEKTIQETEHTKNKIVESLKTLLHVLQKESQYHIKEQ
ncbi:unnamed protein product (macronuclear) [Paramecium tetraurelia]|uniref:Uncharacterized protein n=1 Tax=Paramecium tetraurelia TaxID=5888 RepID=A0DTN0_PARTE|nr:uncharacterized protein GSPATT00020078001 [Paramecium tetraurelia]CAK86397.1 unnamed protein product [Paramecium tetraurelia]|eukprot:XP_001453794.1 hypothetical protein (macronuclear) [Paramecium tetraurelia strain d4-2]